MVFFLKFLDLVQSYARKSETRTSRGCGDFWSNWVFLILGFKKNTKISNLCNDFLWF